MTSNITSNNTDKKVADQEVKKDGQEKMEAASQKSAEEKIAPVTPVAASTTV